MHNMDANKKHKEKARRELLKNATNSIEKSWKQHSTKQQLYGHLPPISKIIQVRQTRYAEYSWITKDKLISNVLLWTFSHGRASFGQQART